MVSSGDVDDAVERRHRRGRGRAVRDLLPSSSAARANTVPPFEATVQRALPRRFCKSCRKALDVFRDFDGELKTCRLCLRVRKKDAKRKHALQRADAKRSGDGDGKKGAAS